jgi:hypothetical protein
MESSFVKGSILSPYMIGEGTVYKRERERERRERESRVLPWSSWSSPLSSAAWSVLLRDLHSGECGGTCVEEKHVPTLRPIPS